MAYRIEVQQFKGTKLERVTEVRVNSDNLQRCKEIIQEFLEIASDIMIQIGEACFSMSMQQPDTVEILSDWRRDEMH